MARSKTSAAWMREHVNDPFVKRAKQQGFRSRAAFKLLEVLERDRLVRPAMHVVDLGAAPGGWSQVVAPLLGPAGSVIAVDLLEMQPLPGVTFIQGDFREEAVLGQLVRALENDGVDLVLSDMAPNISGVASADQARAEHLVELAFEFALEHLKPGGAMLVKAFHGAGMDALRRRISGSFESVVVRKPKASRDRSSEFYLLARGRRAGT
jgi:23S rRNA (uridine2552-2'-O)-methyltransferase